MHLTIKLSEEKAAALSAQALAKGRRWKAGYRKWRSGLFNQLLLLISKELTPRNVPVSFVPGAMSRDSIYP